MRNELNELTDTDLEIVAGGFGGFLAQARANTSSDKGESPKETVTFEYGGLQVHYSSQ